MLERQIKICNKAGIHCRPSGMILAAINKNYSEDTFVIVKDGEECEVNSILSLISLGLMCDMTTLLRVTGPDEEKAIKEIGDLFEYEFDFPKK